MNTGALVKLLRTAKHLNQKTISRELGISQQAYSKIEQRDYINKMSLHKVLKALKSTPEELEELKKLFPQSNQL
jgi:transcriptional regulator with XRE-family HTH domain